MQRWLLPVAVLACAHAWAGESLQDQMRRIEATLGRISSEQQALYQQFNMVQELRRNEERQSFPPLPVYAAPGSPPNYDDMKRQEEARVQRVRDLQYELDRLYARYRDLEDQKRPLLEALAALAQQRGAEGAAKP